jgi:membrane protease YdiL (CAAX protease family)
LRTVQVASTVQGLVLLLAAAVGGAWLGQRLGLAAPAVAAGLAGQSPMAVLRAQCRPALAGGIAGGLLIAGFHALAAPLAGIPSGQLQVPLPVRLLYGGITEEILARWGLMTVAAWACSPPGRRRGAGLAPGPAAVAAALAALAFGLSHLPAAAAALGTLTATAAAWIVASNTAFGLVAGYLYWKHGLEAAIGAHLLAHLAAFAVTG